MQHFYFLCFCSGLLWLAPLASPARAQSLPPATLDGLQKTLKVSKPDTSRVKLWLQLGEHHVQKASALPADRDTAYAYAKRAETLSLSLRFDSGVDQSQLLFIRILLAGKRMDQVHALLQKRKPGTHKIAQLLLLGQHYLKRPRELQVDLDSAEGYVRQALDLSVDLSHAAGQVESLTVLGGVYWERGNSAKAAAYIQQAFPILEQLKDRTQAARLWIILGDNFSYTKEDRPKKVYCHEQALALYRQMGNKEQEALILKKIADLHLQQGKLAQSVGELLEVLRIQKSIHSQQLHYTYDLLGAAYQMMGNYEKAIPYALATIESAQATGDTVAIDIDVFRMRLGYFYTKLGEHQKALQVFQGILTRQQNGSSSKMLIIYCTGHIGRQLLALNRPADALAFLRQTLKRYPPDNAQAQAEASFFLGETYLYLKSYALAEAHFQKSLKILSSENYLRNEDHNTISIYQHLIRLYRETGQYQKSRSFLSQAFGLAKQRKLIKELSETHLQAFKLDSLQGNFSSAIAHYQQYKALNDSIFNEKKSNQLLGFQVQYDTQKKEQDIKLKEKNIALLTQQSKAQQASISLRQTERNALMGGTALLLIILALGYNRYRLKQRSNQELQAQRQQINQKNQDLQSLLEEKEWMMKEIHHRVKNNLQLISGLLYSQSAYLEDPAALTAIRESHNRVHAMALIHQRLYQSDNLRNVAMHAYIEDIVTHLIQSFNRRDSIHLQLEVGPLELDLSLAVPLGLIINEAVTNSLKYAFPGGKAGTIALALAEAAPSAQGDSPTCQLTIADDGPGMPPELDLQQSRTLGLPMIRGLSRQIKGSLEITHQAGVRISLQFNPVKLTKSHVLFA